MLVLNPSGKSESVIFLSISDTFFIEENALGISDDDIKRVLNSTTQDYIDNGPNILKN